MPEGITRNINCGKKVKKPFTPNPHQQLVNDYFQTSPYKGLLLFHKLGSGKSCTSILVADTLLEKGIVKHVFVLSPGSLKTNWLNEYCELCGKSSDFLSANFTMITYNYSKIEKALHKLNFRDSLVIIDEVHNLINGVANRSKNPVAIFNKILKSNCKVLALSGTPVANNNWELGILGQFLKKGTFPAVFRGIDKDLDYKNFSIDDITDEELQGVISYFPGNSSDYPEMIVQEPVKVKMSKWQWDKYNYIYDFELKLRLQEPNINLKKTNPKLYQEQVDARTQALVWARTRRVSNFYYPDEIKFALDIAVQQILNPKKIVLKKGEYVEEAEPGMQWVGWVDEDSFEHRRLWRQYSPKFAAIVVNILSNIGTKHMVYTAFKVKSGTTILKTLLTYCNDILVQNGLEPINVATFSGDLSNAKRDALLNEFNDLETNMNGQKIKVLLVTEAGAEGITLKGVNNLHIVESSNREARTNQAIGRAVRYKSHEGMPEDRKYVNIWRYWSEGPYGEEAIDERLYKEGVVKAQRLEYLTNRMIANSIEAKP